MKASELRIGNYVNHIVFGAPHEMILLNFVELYKNPDAMAFLSPIPITEEWLVRMGFEKKSNEDIVDENTMPVNMWHKDGFWLDDNFVLVNYHDDVVRPKWVHQLQNLFFALTGEELEIKQESPFVPLK